MFSLLSENTMSGIGCPLGYDTEGSKTFEQITPGTPGASVQVSPIPNSGKFQFEDACDILSKISLTKIPENTT